MKKFLTVLTLAALFVCCQKGSQNPPEVVTPQSVTIKPVISKATELSFEQGDKVGLAIIKDDKTKHADNAPMTYRDGMFTSEVVWYEQASTKSQFMAYYPYSTTGMPATFSVGTDQTKEYDSSDLMIAVKESVTPTNDAVDMEFNRLLSRIVVNVNKSDADINSIVIQNSIPTATVDWTNLTATVDTKVAAADIIAQTVTDNSLYRAIVVPQTVSLTVMVTTTQGKTYATKLGSATIVGGGQYKVDAQLDKERLVVSMSSEIENWSDQGEIKKKVVVDPTPEGATAYITKVFDYMPAVGQFTNKLPLYEEGDTQEIMNQKVLAAIGNNKRGLINLGGFGGYVVVGFDHTIANVEGKRDFRVLGNVFYANANPDVNAPEGGSCQPGVIMVAYDADKKGVPELCEWYEIAGSAHEDPKKELWYQKAYDANNDVDIIYDYEITYHKPKKEPTSQDEWATYIPWEDNKGWSGHKVKNQFHKQPYYPLWAKGDKLTFKGTRLPQNGVDESGVGRYYVLYKFRYGYAGNELNVRDDSAIDISWAVNKKGERVHLPGVDFIKIYTGINQENGWLGECATKIMSIEDLHILGVSIDTRK